MLIILYLIIALDLVIAVKTVVNYHLPTTLKPVHYAVSFIPRLEGEFRFQGRVDITFNVTQRTDRVVLHKDAHLDVVSGTLGVVGDGGRASVVAITGTSVEAETDKYVIALGATLEVGRSYNVGMNFSGRLRDDMIGFYRSSYRTKATGELRWLATTQFEATNARKAFPCFDEPAMKATFTITISRPAFMTSVSNMPQDGQPVKHLDTVDGTTRYWDRYLATPPMSTYLVAFLVSDFSHLNDSSHSLRIFARRGMIQQARHSLEVGGRLLDWFSNYTGVEFMMPKMDFVALPDFEAGAMENWGMASFRERVLLVEEGVTTTVAMQLTTTTVAHELCHQWFGDLVTPEWWGNTWLSEGFAEYFGRLSTGAVLPEWRMDDQFTVAVLQEVMVEDSSPSSRPLSVNQLTGESSSIARMFDDISYSKGASIVRMMRHNMLTPAMFQEGIGHYIRARSYGVVTAEYLYSSFSEMFLEFHRNQTDQLDFATVMRSWTEQGGYPVVTVARDYEKATVHISQRAFLLNEHSVASFRHKWFVPLTYTTQRSPDWNATRATNLWLRPNEHKMEIDLSTSYDQWVMFNVLQTGYYRVNYDRKNWRLLISFLDSNSFEAIPPVGRGQLIDDSFNLARAGLVQYCTPLELSRYLRRERDLIPLTAFKNTFELLYSRLSHSPDDYIKKYVMHLLAPAYTHLGFHERKQDSHTTRLARVLVVEIVCKLNHPDCVQKAVKLFNESLEANVTIQADLKKTVYCSAIKNGTTKEWDYMWNLYLESTSTAFQAIIINVLGCSRNATTLTRYLQMTVVKDSPMRGQDSYHAFKSVLNHNVDTALDFFIKHHKQMEKAYSEMVGFGVLLATVSRSINSKRQINKLKLFFKAQGNLRGGTREAFQHAIATVEETLAWQRRKGKVIVTWAENEIHGRDNSRTCVVGRQGLSRRKLVKKESGSKGYKTTPTAFLWAGLSAALLGVL